MTKPTKWVCAHCRPAKTQISLGICPVWSESLLSICPVWSESLLCTQWVAKDPRFLHVDSEDWSDWADAQADLGLRWAHSHFIGFVMSRLLFSQQFTKIILNDNNDSCSYNIEHILKWTFNWFSILYTIITYYTGEVSRAKLGHFMRNCVLCHMQTTKERINLHICAVWSAPLYAA